VAETDVDVEIQHAGQPHEVGLHEYYYHCADNEVIKNAVIFIRKAEYGPVPEQIEEKQHHGEGVVDAATIVAFRFHALAAYFALVFEGQALAQRKKAFVDEYCGLPATGALHGEQRGE
jgi:hypothetical protein